MPAAAATCRPDACAMHTLHAAGRPQRAAAVVRLASQTIARSALKDAATKATGAWRPGRRLSREATVTGPA